MTQKIQLEISADDEDVAYLRLPQHPGSGLSGIVAKQVRLRELLEFKGPDIHLDLDPEGRLIGIEVLL